MTEERYRSLFASLNEGFALHEMIYDESGKAVDYRFLDINEAFERQTGLKREDVVGRPMREALPTEDLYWVEIYAKVADGGEAIRFQNYSSALSRWFEVYAFSPVKGQFAVLFFDVTDRVKRDDELRRLNRTLKAISDSNHAMFDATDEAQYLQEVCRIVVEDCGHAMVWIGYAEHDRGKTVRPVAQAGFDQGYLDTLRVTYADTDRGRGPTGTAIRTGKPSQSRNMLTDPKFGPWRDEALKRGYASSAVFPLMNEGKAFGAINIYSREPDSFADEEVSLLSELASDLAHGILALRMCASKEKAEEELRQSEERYRALVQTAPDAIIVHRDGHFLYANAAALHLYGADSLERLASYSVSDLITADDRQNVIERIRAGMAGQVLPRRLTKLVRLDGREVDVESTSSAIEYQGMRAVQVFIRDMSERKRIEEALVGTNSRLALLSETASQLLRAEDPEALAQSLCENVLGHLGGDVFFNFLLDEASGRLHLNACAGIPEEEKKAIEWLDFGVAVCGCVAKDAQRIIAEDIRNCPEPRTDLVRGLGVQAYVCHPLFGHAGLVIGTLSFGSKTKTRFEDDEIALMKTVADQVATAMERKRAAQRERELDAHKRDFYRQTLLAATDGKLHMSELDEIAAVTGDPIASWQISVLEDVRNARESIIALAGEAGMDRSRVNDFTGCVVEAMANAYKHAHGGNASLYSTDHKLVFVVSDSGPGIGAMALPDVALTRGFSTAWTLGMGYKVMIHFADKVYLATGPEGTTVALEMGIQPQPVVLLTDSK